MKRIKLQETEKILNKYLLFKYYIYTSICIVIYRYTAKIQLLVVVSVMSSNLKSNQTRVFYSESVLILREHGHKKMEL